MMSLISLLQKPSRVVAGLMSGTSLDGIDVTLARLSGSGASLNIEVLHVYTCNYPQAIRDALLRNSLPDQPASVREICQLNALLPVLYEEALRAALSEAGLKPKDLDLIGSHGQTIHHVPQPEAIAGRETVSTLQIGDASVLANRMGVPVVADFRPADMALGGQGAPLVPYLDYVMFTHPAENRGLQNIGGIGNIAVLRKNGKPEDVRAFDTGPGNMIINGLMQALFQMPWDPNGTYAARGTVQENLLTEWLSDPWYAAPPPKSTGREVYNETFIHRLIQENPHLAPEDLLATATMFTARTIHTAYTRFIAPVTPLDVLIVSGGGIHNQTLMHMLADAFASIPVRTLDAYNVSADGKEALCFAVLAHEYLNEQPTNLPSVTGASRPALLGKLALP